MASEDVESFRYLFPPAIEQLSRPRACSLDIAINHLLCRAAAPPTVAAVHPTVALRQKKVLDNLDQQVNNIEKAVQKAVDAELHTAEQHRLMQVARNAFTSTHKFIEAQEKATFPGEQAPKLDPIKSRIAEADKKLEERESKCLPLIKCVTFSSLMQQPSGPVRPF